MAKIQVRVIGLAAQLEAVRFPYCIWWNSTNRVQTKLTRIGEIASRPRESSRNIVRRSKDEQPRAYSLDGERARDSNI